MEKARSSFRAARQSFFAKEKPELNGSIQFGNGDHLLGYVEYPTAFP
jgi:hypothetical protein